MNTLSYKRAGVGAIVLALLFPIYWLFAVTNFSLDAVLLNWSVNCVPAAINSGSWGNQYIFVSTATVAFGRSFSTW